MRPLRILGLFAIVLARVEAEKVAIHDIVKQQEINHHTNVSPFLSATLSAKLTGTDLGTFDKSIVESSVSFFDLSLFRSAPTHPLNRNHAARQFLRQDIS